MITKSRKDILIINPFFTQFIVDMQLSFRPSPYEEGERIIMDLMDEEETVLTKELAEKLNLQQLENFEKNRDINPFVDSEKSAFIESRLFVSPKDNTEEYLNDLAYSIESIRKVLKEDYLMVLGDWNTPWLYQENDYLPANNTLDFLKQNIEKGFNGGFLLKGTDVTNFIPHLFWLTRCNASLPYFYMSYPSAKTIISICKYGVMHFEFYDEIEKTKILQNLTELNFKEIDECEDPIYFDDFNGRSIVISD